MRGPSPSSPYCAAHDPVSLELRRQERQSARARLEAVRKAITRCPPLVRARMLELLVVEGYVTPGVIDKVMRKFPLGWSPRHSSLRNSSV